MHANKNVLSTILKKKNADERLDDARIFPSAVKRRRWPVNGTR
jgi:hypothetical protein